MMYARRWFLVIVVLLTLCVSVCNAQDLNKQIIGKWRNMLSTEGLQLLEFLNDDTVVIVMAGNPPMLGNYRVMSPTAISLDSAQLGSAIMSISIKGNEMELGQGSKWIRAEYYKKPKGQPKK